MNIYLAARYPRREEVAGYALELEEAGHTVTSRWLSGDDELIENAGEFPSGAGLIGLEDLDDIASAEVLIAFTENPVLVPTLPAAARGGRHVEFGYAVAQKKQLIIVGPTENIFHTLSSIRRFDLWGPEVIAWVDALDEDARTQVYAGTLTHLWLDGAKWDSWNAMNEARERLDISAVANLAFPNGEAGLVLVTGIRGTGKSVFAATVTANVKADWPSVQVKTNYNLPGLSDFYRDNLVTILASMELPQLAQSFGGEGGIVLLADNGYAFAPVPSVLKMRLIRELKKLNCSILLVTQSEDFLPADIKNGADRVVRCERVYMAHEPFEQDPKRETGAVQKFTYMDNATVEERKVVRHGDRHNVPNGWDRGRRSVRPSPILGD